MPQTRSYEQGASRAATTTKKQKIQKISVWRVFLASRLYSPPSSTCVWRRSPPLMSMRTATPPDAMNSAIPGFLPWWGCRCRRASPASQRPMSPTATGGSSLRHGGRAVPDAGETVGGGVRRPKIAADEYDDACAEEPPKEPPNAVAGGGDTPRRAPGKTLRRRFARDATSRTPRRSGALEERGARAPRLFCGRQERASS